MSVIKFKNVNKSYGDINALKNITFDINEGDKVGIIGKNGAGKSTLINIISGNEKADSGNVIIDKNIKIGYLKQSTDYDLTNLIKNENIADFMKINSYFDIKGELSLKNLSGGEKTKLALASVLAQKPALLLLDEPTNHADIKAIRWIIKEINRYKGTVLIVSHDRYFLNKTVFKIIELSHHEAKVYEGNYDSYEISKSKELKQNYKQYISEQKEDKKIQKEIRKLNSWSEKGERDANRQGGSITDAMSAGMKDYHQKRAAKLAKNAKNKKTRLQQKRKNYIAKPVQDKPVKFNFKGYNTSNNLIIEVKDLAKSFNNHLIFSHVNLNIYGGEKIGLIGDNGTGKTTFIKLLLDKDLKDKGKIWKSSSLKIAYMSQDVTDLDNKKTILQLANEYDVSTKELFLSNLINMGIKRIMLKKKVKDLSLGQKMKIKLVQIIIDDYNLLILDEPTNHLDLENKKVLENALINYKGTVIIASHDQYLLSKVTNKVFIFEDYKIKKSEYGYSEYIKRMK